MDDSLTYIAEHPENYYAFDSDDQVVDVMSVMHDALEGSISLVESDESWGVWFFSNGVSVCRDSGDTE